MKQDLIVTIATNLNEANITNNKSFNHSSVLDLRRCVNNRAFPIEENVLGRLSNFHVAYEQMPMSLYSENKEQEEALIKSIKKQKGAVLIVEEQAAPVARFCQQSGIAFTSDELFVVETAKGDVPVEMKLQRPSKQIAKPLSKIQIA